MPIASPIGFLDVVNATLRASQVESTSRLTVANTAATKNFSVGDRFHIDKDSVDPVSVTGNVVASGIKISNLTISPIFDLGAVSNVGNTTSNTLQFANATTSFVTSSNVEIGGNISLTSNAQVKVGSNVLAEYTGPHGRDPKEVPLKKYPEIAFDESKFDGNDTTNTYTQAGYTATTSSQLRKGYGPWRAFNHKAHASDEPGWATSTSSSLYDETTGQATSNATLFDGNRGEYIDLKLPHKIKVSHFTIRSRVSPPHSPNDHPSSGHLYGSNDGSNWVKLTSYSGLTYQGSDMSFETVTVNATEYYNHLRLTATARVAGVSGSSWVDIGELEYYGYEEPAPIGDLSLDTTLKSTFNSVRSNNYVMYFDGEDPAAGNVPKYLVSGSAKSITPNNVVFDATNNCWTLNGSTESNVTTADLGFEGDAPHTVSTWINASNLEANALTQQLFSIGSGYDKSFLKVDDTQIAANTWHNVTYAYQGEGGSKVTYVDGRKVEEAQVEDTFGEYPPFAMTDYETGGYRVSASNFQDGDYYPWEAFDKSGDLVGWYSEDLGNYNGTNGAVTTTSTVRLAPETEKGEWLQLEFPSNFNLNYFVLYSQNYSPTINTPDNFILYAKKNSSDTWTSLGTYTGTAAGQSAAGYTGTVDGSEVYKYFAIVVTKRFQSSGANGVAIRELKLYGHKEGDLTRFPEPTRVLRYPHVTMTGPGHRGYGASASSNSADAYAPWKAFDNDTSGDNGWTASGTPYSTSDGSYAGGTTYQTTVTGHTPTAVNGEFLQLELTHKIKPTKFRITSYTGDGSTGSGRQPKNGVFAGSNDGTNWVLLKSYTNETSWTQGTFVEITPDTNTSNYYKYIRLIVTDVQSTTDGTVTIHGLEILGTQEDTGTPAIVGGPFAGKVANFRVYDQYLGDERIQEIYDAQKDAFGHKKSSMTFYKGRVGVGTTEPEGALTVIDEPHTLEKFPARAVSANDSYVDGDGQIKLSAVEGSGYQAFDGLTSTSWTAAPTRNTRLSEEVDFGAWLKIQTPESVSLKKAEIESNPYWRQVGNTFQGAGAGYNLGSTVACNKDGTRIAIAEPASGGTITAAQDGRVRIYDWNGSAWTQVGQNLTGNQSDYYGAGNMGFSDDGSRFITSSPNDDTPGGATPNAGVVEVYYLSGAPGTSVATWTILGTPFTSSDGGAQVGKSCAISGDGNTIAFVEYQYDDANIGVNAGRTRVFTWNGTTWVQKGSDMIGDVTGDGMGRVMEMTSDGNYVIIGNYSAGSNNGKVWIYAWGGSDWVKRGNTLVGTGADLLGFDVTISDDANTIAIGENHNDVIGTEAGAVEIRTWNGSAYVLTHTLYDPEATSGRFGSAVALSGDGTRLVAVTHHYPAGSGSAHGRARVFEYNGTSWELRIPVTSIGALGNQGTDGSGSALGQEDGLAVSRDGSVIVVGLPNDDTSGNANSGQVKVFSMPSNIKSIWGSNDDVNWTKITTGNETFRVTDRLEFKNLDNPNYYKYHAIVADAFTRLKDVKLYGIRNQGSSTLHDGTLTLTKNLDVPRIGPPPDADDTPQRNRLVVEYNTSTNPLEDGVVRDTSGRGNDIVMYGNAKYDVSEKAFRLDGTSGTYMSGTQNLGTGTPAHTITGWFKQVVSLSNWTYVMFIGTSATGQMSGMLVSNTGQIVFDIYNTRIDTTVDVIDGTWYHFAGVFKGGTSTWDNASTDLYINGQLEGSAAPDSGTQYSFNLTGNGIQFGSSTNLVRYFNGLISNFKLYDCALTAQEVKTLYDMGRCSNAIPKTLHIMGGMMRYNNDINRLQIHNGLAWITIGGISAVGGTVEYINEYTVHTFTSSDTFIVTSGGEMEYLVVAGGGGSSAGFYSGGGGAGGMLTGTTTINAGSYTITRGSGGAVDANGTSSSIGSLVITTGGGKGGGNGNAGSNGGSGGGGAYVGGGSPGTGALGGTGVSGPPRQGYNGGRGNGQNGYGWGGGGGGAGGNGFQAISTTQPGHGGVGLQSSISGTSRYYAGGGGGNIDTSGNSANGGLGGGGNGSQGGGNAAGTNGEENTGGGGGNKRAGGSGIVIIRYLT